MDLQSFRQQSNLEEVVFYSESGDHLTGKVYRLLLKSYFVDHLLKSRIHLWNQDLKREDTDVKWWDCWNLPKDIAVNENLRLIQYKIMYRTYCTRDKVHTYNPHILGDWVNRQLAIRHI